MLVASNTDIQTDIVITIRTSSLKKAEAIKKLASFPGDIQVELPQSDSSEAILSLLLRQFSTKEFRYHEAKEIVKANLGFSSSCLRLNLQLAIKKGILTRVKSGVYSFVDVKKEIEAEDTAQQDEPDDM